MFKNFNSQHLLIGIFIVFIIFIFISRENFYSWKPIPSWNPKPSLNPIKKIPTLAIVNIPRQLPANKKTCPHNSTLINDEFCEYSQSIQRPRFWGIPLQCPHNYQPYGRTKCLAINPRTSPKLTCNDNSVPVDGMCQECPLGGKLSGGMCYSCKDNKKLEGAMCF